MIVNYVSSSPSIEFLDLLYPLEFDQWYCVMCLGTHQLLLEILDQHSELRMFLGSSGYFKMLLCSLGYEL